MDRLAAIHELRTRLHSGGTSVGSWMQIPHASIAEIMGRAGYDWVALDLEHGAIGVHQLPDLCRALELGLSESCALKIGGGFEGRPREAGLPESGAGEFGRPELCASEAG
jgi:hypothetical protein